MSSDELWAASRSGDEARVRALLSVPGVDANHVSGVGSTSLLEAVEKNHAIIASLLLEHGANVRAVDRAHWTALHVAAYSNHADCVRVLLAHAAPLDALNDDHSTPLHLAALTASLDSLRILLPLASLELLAAVADVASSPDVKALVTAAIAAAAPPSAPPPSLLKPLAAPSAARHVRPPAARPLEPVDRAGAPARPKLPSVARVGPTGPRPPPARSQPLDSSAPPDRALSPRPQRSAAMFDATQRAKSPPPRRPPQGDGPLSASVRTPQRLASRRPAGLAPAARQPPPPGRSPPDAAPESDAVSDAVGVPRVSRIPLPSFSALPGSAEAAAAAAAAAAAPDSPSLARRTGDSVLILKVAELEAQNKKLRAELADWKARSDGDSSTAATAAASALRMRVKQLEDQLELMELALPIQSDEQSKPSVDAAKATFFKTLGKLPDAALQTLLVNDAGKHIAGLVIDTLERQSATSGESVGLAAVSLAQAVAQAVGKLDDRGGSADAAQQRSVMTNRLATSGLATLMASLAHLAANSSACSSSVHKATRALFMSMLASGLMVRAADGGIATTASTHEADEARRKGLERNLSAMRLAGDAAAPSGAVSPRTQYQSMPAHSKAKAADDIEAPRKPAPVSQKATAAAAAAAAATAAATTAATAGAPATELTRGRSGVATRTRGRRASSVEAPRLQAQLQVKESEPANRTLSPGRRIMGVIAPKASKAKVERSAPTPRRDGTRNIGGMATVEFDGMLLIRSAAAADASGRLFADASKAIDTSFALASVVLLSNGHLEFRRMPTASAQAAKEAARSLRGRSLTVVCALLLKDCIQMADVLTSDLAAAREVAKCMLLTVRELKRVVTDVATIVAPRMGASDDVAVRCEAAMANLSNNVAVLVKLAKEDLSDETIKLDVDNRAKHAKLAVATAMRALLDVLPAACRVMVTSPESTSGSGAVPLEPGVVVQLSGSTHEVAIDSTSECLFRVREKLGHAGHQFKSRSDDAMMDVVNALELCGLSATF
jgi:trimeric autotransporter adhesin